MYPELEIFKEKIELLDEAPSKSKLNIKIQDNSKLNIKKETLFTKKFLLIQ
ncbi:MAG: hypothetical protein LBQ24_06705 [Candidatus Peribacteria bacterium]|nr:hypothetical protein [Candidatus Peribacteria bacterium]